MNEVKRQAMSEVQKAVAEAEQKAFEMIASERARMEQTIADAKRQATEDAFLVINEQEESTEVRSQGNISGSHGKSPKARTLKMTRNPSGFILVFHSN